MAKKERRKDAPTVGKMFFKTDGTKVLVDSKSTRFETREKVSKKVAKEKGLTYFWNDSVCSKCGNLDYRYTCNGACVACQNKKPVKECLKKARQVRKSTQDLEMALKLKKLSEDIYDF